MQDHYVSGHIKIIATLMLLALAQMAVLAAPPPPDLTSLGLEELSQLEVTTISRRPEKANRTAAAVYVITGDDIRRSGVHTLPDALRLAPGVDVARINSNQWSVGIRGFGSRLSRSMLVLIDGRSVYNPLFAGVYWEVQDTYFPDIERIEVIRGPGGSLWGSNAVNGIINIITKNAKNTLGGLVSAGGGTEERDFASARYGGHVGSVYYRTYVKYFDRDASSPASGVEFDDWRKTQGGFRVDWDANTHDQVTLQGDVYGAQLGEQRTSARFTSPFSRIYNDDAHASGGNVLGRWQHTISDDSDFSFQTYYDRTHRRDPDILEDRNTGDWDFQHRFLLGQRNHFTWGAGYRVTGDRTESDAFVFDPARRTSDVISFFVQDELRVIEDRFHFIFGNKVENNDYSGWENQPSVQAVVFPSHNQTIWAAVSRAVRIPSRIEHDFFVSAPLPSTTTITQLIGNPSVGSEKVIAYELGHRMQPTRKIATDVALFYNQYRDFLSIERGTPYPDPTDTSRLIAPITFANGVKGYSEGAELAVNWLPSRHTRFRFTYTYIYLDLRTVHTSRDTSTELSTERLTPRHQATAHTSIDLGKNVDFDPIIRYVDNRPNGNIPAYAELDLRLGWRPIQRLELSLVGQNLLHKSHPESSRANEIERGVFGRGTWAW